MALIKCEECSKELKDNEYYCLNCGKKTKVEPSKKTIINRNDNQKMIKILLWIFLLPIMLGIFVYKNDKIEKRYKAPIIIGIIIVCLIIGISSGASNKAMKEEVVLKCYNEKALTTIKELGIFDSLNGINSSVIKCKDLKLKTDDYNELVIEVSEENLIGIKIKDGSEYKYIYYKDKSYDIYDVDTLEIKEIADKNLKAEREQRELEDQKARKEQETREKAEAERLKKIKNFTAIGLSEEQSEKALTIIQNCGIDNIGTLTKGTATENVTAYKFGYDGYEITITIAENEVYQVGSGTLILYTKGSTAKRFTDYVLSDSEKSNLKTLTEETVKSILKSPSTAKFPGGFLSPYEDWGLSQEGLIYKVSSYVDSQNSFGATIRSNFYIEFNFNSNGDLTIKTFTFDGQKVK